MKVGVGVKVEWLLGVEVFIFILVLVKSVIASLTLSSYRRKIKKRPRKT